MTEKPKEEMVGKKEEDATYCPICMPMGCECKGKLMPSKWKDNNNRDEQKEYPKLVAALLAPFPQQYKPYKFPYFDRMLNKQLLGSPL